ncbi:unnamed protein product [Alternaria alternata]
MPAPWRRGVYEKVEYVVVERDGVQYERGLAGEEPTATVNAKRDEPSPTDADYDSDSDEDDYPEKPNMTAMTTASLTIPTGTPALLITMTLGDEPQATPALADNDPTETIVIAMPPPPPRPHHDRPISQTTEHLLIAAGSIGATIIIVMVVLAMYTMRKRGLTFKDVLQQGKQQLRRGSPPPPPQSRYGLDKKNFDDEYTYGMNDSFNAPQPTVAPKRSSSLSSQKRLQPLGRSDSFNQPPTRDGTQSFYDDTPSISNSHRRNDSATPSSPVLPIEGQRRSASTRNTRSMDGDEESLRFPDPSQEHSRNLPPPPTFRQFLSNRPSISQRPGFGGASAAAAGGGFAIDSWVNQQSNRVEEQRLKQQFRMTQSTTYSDDEVPEMPALPSGVPKNASGITRQPSAAGLSRNGSKSGLVGRDIKHQRHDTQTTAPIFKAHPGTEVRFSTRSAVPSEILDRGRDNFAL